MDKPARRRGEPGVTEIFFILGALLVLVVLIYSIRKSWPTFDPLALAMLIGIGFLLVVVCERLRVLVREVRTSPTISIMASRPAGGSGETPCHGESGVAAGSHPMTPGPESLRAHAVVVRVITVCREERRAPSADLHRSGPDLWGHLIRLGQHGRQRGGASHGSFFDVHMGARKICMIAEGRQALDTNLTSAVR
jgi:hypothetical protein